MAPTLCGVLYGSLRTVGNSETVVVLRTRNREYLAGPYKLDLGLLARLALSIGGCPKQLTLRESSNGSTLVLFPVFNIEVAATGCSVSECWHSFIK